MGTPSPGTPPEQSRPPIRGKLNMFAVVFCVDMGYTRQGRLRKRTTQKYRGHTINIEPGSGEKCMALKMPLLKCLFKAGPDPPKWLGFLLVSLEYHQKKVPGTTDKPIFFWVPKDEPEVVEKWTDWENHAHRISFRWVCLNKFEPPHPLPVPPHST